MNMVGCVILVVLAVIGAAAVTRELALRLFCGREEATVLLVTHIKDGENIELALRSALARRRWWGRGAEGVVCLDCPLDERTRRICESICRDYGFHSLMTKEEFVRSLD